MRRVVVLTVLLALVVHPMALGPVAAQTDPTIERTTTLSLTPDEPGSVDATVAFDVPSSLSALTTSVPESATVTETVGFDRNPDGTFTWKRGDPGPRLTLALSANETGIGLREGTFAAATQTMNTGYEFVDTGPWAVVSAPAMTTEWRYTGDEPAFESTLSVAGDGVTGERMAYLGPVSTHRRTAYGQTFTLAVPAAADLEADPAAILDSLEMASNSLRVDERDPRVTIIAAPTGIDWAALGLAGDADAWVQADQPLDDPNNVWLHEYVHTRSDYRTTEDARWTTEGIAEYYAAVLTLEQGHIGFEAFADHLELGSRQPYASSTLTRPDTWSAGANYLKGALVIGGLDRRLRVETGSSRTAGDLLARMNAHDSRVSHAFLLDTVEEIDGQATADYLDRYATTDAAPEMWSRDDHSAAFSVLPPRMVVDEDLHFEISGPYRNVTTNELPVLVPGETLTVAATVTNEGDVAGSYDLALILDGDQRDTITGTLDGGASRTIAVDATVETIGVHSVTVGEVSREVVVESPATPRVTDVTVDEQTIAPGDTVSISITATNEATKPATGTVSIRVDGTTVATWNPVLGSGESVSVTQTVDIEEPGTHEIMVDSHPVTVTVESTLTTGNRMQTTGNPVTPTQTPGFSVVLAGISFAAVAAFVALRSGQ